MIQISKVEILKFGGSGLISYNAPEEQIKARICDIAEHIEQRIEQGEKIVIVVSALSKLTDHLKQQMVKELNGGELPKNMDKYLKSLDEEDRKILDKYLITHGEFYSCKLTHCVFDSMGIDSEVIVPNKNFPIKVDKNGEVEQDETKQAIKERVEKIHSRGAVVIAPGFLGVGEQGDIVTLGRDSSDYSMMLFAHGCSADKVYKVGAISYIPGHEGRVGVQQLMPLKETYKGIGKYQKVDCPLHPGALEILAQSNAKLHICSYNAGQIVSETIICSAPSSL